LEPNAFKKSPEIRQIAKTKYFSQTHSKFARIPESGDKFANMATLVQDCFWGVESSCAWVIFAKFPSNHHPQPDMRNLLDTLRYVLLQFINSAAFFSYFKVFRKNPGRYFGFLVSPLVFSPQQL